MSIPEQVYAQALLMAGQLEEAHQQLLKILSQGAATALAAQLRPGLTPADCRADFVAAASLLALASFNGAARTGVERFQAGEVSFQLSQAGADAASACLRRQAELVIAPYLRDRVAFLGV